MVFVSVCVSPCDIPPQAGHVIYFHQPRSREPKAQTEFSRKHREEEGKKEKRKRKKGGSYHVPASVDWQTRMYVQCMKHKNQNHLKHFDFCVCFHSSFLNLINVVHKTGENEKIRVVSGTDCTRQKRLVARPFFFFFLSTGCNTVCIMWSKAGRRDAKCTCFYRRSSLGQCYYSATAS